MQYEERTRIATPEGVELELVLAGLASRFMAEAVDAALLLLVLAATIAVAALIAGGSAGLLLVDGRGRRAGCCSSVAYHVAFEVLAAGRTPGKRACGLRVVMEGGEPVGLRASAVRNLLRLLEGPATFYVPAIVVDPRHPPQPAARRPRRRHAGRSASRAPARRRGATAGDALPPTAAAGLRPTSGTCRRSRRRSSPRVRSFLDAPRRRSRRAARRGLARELADAARRQGRRPAAGPAARDAARGHRRREVRPIMNTQPRPRRGGSRCRSSGAPRAASSWEHAARHAPSGGAERAARRASGGASPRCSSTA